MKTLALMIFVLLHVIAVTANGITVGGQERETPPQWRTALEPGRAQKIRMSEHQIIRPAAQANGTVFADLFPRGRRIRAGRSEFSSIVDIGGTSRVVIRIEASASNNDSLGYLIRFGPMPDGTLTLYNDDQGGLIFPGEGLDVALPVRSPMVQLERVNLSDDDLLLGAGASIYAVP